MGYVMLYETEVTVGYGYGGRDPETGQSGSGVIDLKKPFWYFAVYCDTCGSFRLDYEGIKPVPIAHMGDYYEDPHTICSYEQRGFWSDLFSRKPLRIVEKMARHYRCRDCGNHIIEGKRTDRNPRHYVADDSALATVIILRGENWVYSLFGDFGNKGELYCLRNWYERYSELVWPEPYSVIAPNWFNLEQWKGLEWIDNTNISVYQIFIRVEDV